MALQNNTHEDEELLGLFEVMGALLDDPDWAQAHPQPCTDTPWPGVDCEVSIENPSIFHVTKIHIGPDIIFPPCKPSAFLSESLVKLQYLKTLSIFSCFVTSNVTLPPSIFHPSSSLEHLALQSNPTLYGDLPQTLGEVASLKVISLSQNNLQGNIPKQIGGLLCLEQLDLSYNHFSGHIPNEIGGLKSLSILDISWNEIEGDLPDSLGELQFLTKMDLGSNKLTGKVPTTLGRLKRLVLLDMSHNFISGPIPESLSSLELLEYLLIDDNPIKARLPQFIGFLKNLESISISGCGLIGPIPNSLSSLKNLTSLSINNNSLMGTVPPNLGSLQNLDELNLSHNNLSGVLEFSDEFIGRLGTRLDVRGNRGLCISYELHKKNLSSYLEIPACLDRRHKSGKPLADAGIKPSCYDNIISSSTSYLHLEVVQFTFALGFVLDFLSLF